MISKHKTGISSQVSIPDNYIGSVIVCDGNSLTYGVGSSSPPTSSYPTFLKNLDPFVNDNSTIYNLGVGGQTTQQMIDDAITQVDPLYNSNVRSVVVAWEIGNDIGINGDVTGSISRYASYCSARKSTGFKVVAVTLTPRSQSTSFGDTIPQYNTKLGQANTLLRSGYMTYADALCDIAADDRFQNYNPTYYASDNVHYSDQGYEIVAQLVKQSLLTL